MGSTGGRRLQRTLPSARAALTIGAIGLSAALLGGTAAAQTALPLANGNFGAGLTGWKVTGDALVRAGMLSLTTAATSADGDAAFNLSGRPAAPFDAVAEAAGVAPRVLDSADASAYEGSAAAQTFSVKAGQTLRLDWLVVSRDARFVDRAFIVVDGDVATLAEGKDAAGPGLRTWRRTFDRAQRVTLVLGIVDTGDHAGVSSLRVRDVRLERRGTRRSGPR